MLHHVFGKGVGVTQPIPADPGRRWWRARPQAWWWIALVVVIPVIALTGLAAWLLVITTHPTKAAERIELVKTALAVGAGTGGVITLILASRRQWHTEQAQLGTEHDAAERRITDLYTKAADQLGSDKAPVRLAGLYALERLAQDNPAQRQTIVNVMCAYLRMPYIPPAEQVPTDDAPESDQARFEARTQEHQVRHTAQRILAAHLRTGRDHVEAVFWPDVDVDFTGATLIDLDFHNCHMRAASFARARFIGDASFTEARFSDDARFNGAQFPSGAKFTGSQFAGTAMFAEAYFGGRAWFADVTFAGAAWFVRAQFEGDAGFDRARIVGDAGFVGAQFMKGARFGDARFIGKAEFGLAQVSGDAEFREAEFASDATFIRARFAGVAMFDEAQFAGIAMFAETIFDGDARFSDAVFAGQVKFDRAQFAGAVHLASWVRLDVSTGLMGYAWPPGWKVVDTSDRPDPSMAGKWGRLMPPDRTP
ncbi:MAG TPA: pentapeptide repeat-containing protein [Pseudonocardiaceae bacterium]